MSHPQQLVIFQIGNESFGADIKAVNEIIRMQSITKVPNMPSYVEGVTNLRGKLCTVINLKKKLNYLDSERSIDESKIVIVNDSKIGLIVDSVKEIVTIDESQIQSLDTIFMGNQLTALSCVAKIKEDIISVLDVPQLTKDFENGEKLLQAVS